ncbi:MAG: hypothetical protein RLZZ628_1405 [Bacteroidota bacterium]|jgi:hypothetical protein
MSKKIDWDGLTVALKNNRCVLFLGPDAYPYDEKQTVEQAMWAHTIATQSHLVLKFYADDGLVLFKKAVHRNLFRETMVQFYENHQNWNLTNLQLQKMVQLPFLAIVNFTLDDLLYEYFKSEGFTAQFVPYIFKPNLTEKIIQDLSLNLNKTLILNLLGTFRSCDNLVLTHADLFDFLKIIFNDKNAWLKELLHQADFFLFIGVSFEKWYFQLLKQQLAGYTKSGDDAERYALLDGKSIQFKDLYEHQLKIQFIEDTAHYDVITQLYEFCAKSGILKQPSFPKQSYKDPTLQKIYEKLLSGKLKEAIDTFLEYATDRNTHNRLVTISSSYHHFEKDLNVLSIENKSIERNKILNRVLECLNCFSSED